MSSDVEMEVITFQGHFANHGYVDLSALKRLGVAETSEHLSSALDKKEAASLVRLQTIALGKPLFEEMKGKVREEGEDASEGARKISVMKGSGSYYFRCETSNFFVYLALAVSHYGWFFKAESDFASLSSEPVSSLKFH